MKTTFFSVAATALSLVVGSAVLTVPVQAGCNNFSSVHAEYNAADTRCTAAVGITTINDDQDDSGDNDKDDDNKTWGDLANEIGKRLEKELDKKQ